MRGGRSLDSLDAFAARCRAGATPLGDVAAAGGVAFVAVCIDDDPRVCAREARRKWPHLAHFWIDSKNVASARIAFVPNRAVVRRDRSVAKWWDGSNGNVLRGPHGASRTNGSQSLVRAIASALDDA